MDSLLVISPCDGRYNKYTKCCQNYFTEYAIQKERVTIEIKYLYKLMKSLPSINIPDANYKILFDILDNFDINECKKIKEIENVIKHDVKAVEIYIKNILLETQLKDYVSFIHFGLTSQDLNNVIYPILIKSFIEKEYNILLEMVIKKLDAMHTKINNIKYKCKFGGAVGNLNAHCVAYPNYDWETFANDFTKDCGCIRSKYTTQIDNYENLSIIFDTIKRTNTVLIDLCQDIWLYIFKNYLQLSINKDEVGSSTMPHKVNPIDFENAEGNLGLSNALFEFMSRKLPVSRLQRDLTDSTVLRNVGMAFGYSVIALQKIFVGLDKIIPNVKTITDDLNNNSVVIAEAYQTILRKYNMTDAYDKLKDFTRDNNNKTIEEFKTFIMGLDITDNIKEECYKVTLSGYVGICYTHLNI